MTLGIVRKLSLKMKQNHQFEKFSLSRK